MAKILARLAVALILITAASACWGTVDEKSPPASAASATAAKSAVAPENAKKSAPDQTEKSDKGDKAEKSEKTPAADEPVVTEHAITLAGQEFKFTATTGCLAIKDEAGKPRADMFFVAYTRGKPGDPADPKNSARPVTFVFNGGPGAAAIWLHVGALGPKRVLSAKDGTALPTTVELVDNDFTWLDFTDLVFIDPVGTGYSRPASGIDLKEFTGIHNDVQSVGEFIRLYVTRYQRWLSPKFLAGESYGTTRAAALSGHLQSHLAMTVNGLVLISSVLDFQAIRFERGNDLPYTLYLPSYAAAAQYHKKLIPDLQKLPLDELLAKVEHWADTDYRAALAKGDTLSDGEREKIVDQLAAFTGLSKSFIRSHHLRLDQGDFANELLREENRRLGLYDARVAGIKADEEAWLTDPSIFVTAGPLVAGLNDYVRRDLKYKNELSYKFLNPEVGGSWNWGSAAGGYVNVGGTLQQAMSANTRLKVLVCCGQYDLVTAYAAQRYTVHHLGLDPAVRDNISLKYYPAGHMLYVLPSALESLHHDAAAFFKSAM